MCRLSIHPTDRGETRHVHASLYIGYLWPLWDAKRQTFADNVCGTVRTTRR